MTRAFRVLIAGACAFLSVGAASAEIVDTLGGFDAKKDGWSGRLGASFSVSGGNTDEMSLSGAGRLQWQNASERFRVLAGGTRETTDGERNEENVLGHVRHNHRLVAWLRTLAFIQFQNNRFQRLKARTLLGAGFRTEPVATDRWSLAMGAAHMLELERLEGERETTTAHRLSTFVALDATPREGVELAASAFVQPRWDDVEDVRIATEASASSRLVGRLSLVVSTSFTYDAKAPADVEREDWSVESGLSLTL